MMWDARMHRVPGAAETTSATRRRTDFAKRLRWEYTSCSLLTPGEAGLLLYYNSSTVGSAAG